MLFGYFINCTVPLVAVKSEDRDDFLKTHLRQGIGLILVEIVFNIIRGALSGIAATIAGILVLVLFVLAIIGIINAVKAKNEKLPLLGDLFDKIGSSMIK